MIELGSFAFLRPWWLLALPALAIALRVTRQRRAGLGDWARAVDPHLLDAMLKRQGAAMGAPRNRAILWAVALVALALSGPAIERGDTKQFRNLDATLIVLDVSNGAGLPQAVAAAQFLLAQSGARQMGLLLYAGDAYLASPLTNDAAALSALLFAVDDHTVPDGGARPERALALARRVLRDAHIIAADVALITAGEGVDAAAAREATRLGAEGHALHTLFVTGDAPDASRREAELSGLAAAGRGLAGNAAQPDDVASRISGRATAHVSGSALQTLGWRDSGQLVLILAAASLLLYFRGGAP
jgi:Ca-activated chloride channel family protein